MQVTCGVISRIQHIVESPYLHSFCEHYLNYLDFDKIYFICFDNNDIPLVQSGIQDVYKDKCQILSSKNKTPNVNRAFKQFIPQIKTNFILHVDLDEYLYLNGGTVKDFLKEYPDFNYFRFQWLQVPSENLFESNLKDAISSANIHAGFNGKTMCINKLKGIKPHDMKLTIDKKSKIFNIKKRNQLYFVIHFCSRGLYDLILKMYYQHLPNSKPANISLELQPFLHKKIKSTSEIPSRVLILMRLSSTSNLSQNMQKHIIKNLNENLPDIYVNVKKMEKHVQKMTLKVPNDIVDFYQRLKKKISTPLFKNFEGNHHQFLIFYKQNNKRKIRIK